MYCLWLLSYNAEIGEAFSHGRTIPSMVDTIRQVTKVKIIRVGLACLKVWQVLIIEPQRLAVEQFCFHIASCVLRRPRLQSPYLQQLSSQKLKGLSISNGSAIESCQQGPE